MGQCLFTRVTYVLFAKLSLLCFILNLSNYSNHLNDYSSAAMLDAVFAEVQKVLHQSLEFPLHWLSHIDRSVIYCYIFILI